MNRWLPLLLAGFLAAPAAAYDDLKFLPSWKLDDMSRPGAVASAGWRTFVIDQDKQALFIYDEQGKLLKSVGRAGPNKEQFSSPEAVFADGRGRVYVADTGNNRVQVLDEDGKFLLSFGRKGSGPGELKRPGGISVGEDGRVYVADTGNDRVQVFSGDGVFLFGFGVNGTKEGQMRSPASVAVDAADEVYVLDSGNDRVLKFDPQTRYQKAFNLLGSSFALDRYGYFYVLDAKARKIREMNREGTLEGAFGTRGEGNGQFKELSAVAVAPDGSILAVDSELKRLTRVVLTSKLKTTPVAMNLSTKLLVSGPTATWPVKATAIAAANDTAYAFLPEAREFAAINKEGKTTLRFGGRSSKEGMASKDSEGIAASADQGVFVADTSGDRLLHFDANGAFSASFAQSTGFFDSKKKEGRVKSPHGLAITEKGVLYVANTGARRVDAYNPDGSFLFSIGPELDKFELKQPVSVAWASEGFVYILDRDLKRVFKCEPSGGYVASWGEESKKDKEKAPAPPAWMPAQPVSQMVDPVALAAANTYVYVLDVGAKRVEVFSKDGEWVTNFLSAGEDEKSLSDPSGLATRGQEILVSDPGKSRVSTFVLHPLLAPPLAISASAVEGVASIKWQASPDAWAGQYRVLRSTGPFGPFEAAGTSLAAEFKDKSVTASQTYYYRVATEAKSGDVGPSSPIVELFVPASNNRAPVEISSVTIGDIFSANYKYYLKNPVGTLTLVNNTNLPYQNVKVSFRLKDFMDFGTEVVVPRLEAGERKEIALTAVLNNRILGVTEDTPIQAEFTLTYFDNGKQQDVSVTKPLRVYSRNAIKWDKPDRIATFVTLNDTPVKDFQRQVMVQAGAVPAGAAALVRPLRNAILLWDAIAAAGLKYQPSPNSPFESVSQDPAFPVDYTQFPRETLKHKSGQCDDLATLFSSLLEAASVKTALLDYPGHMALMFDTGVNDPLLAGMPESDMISYNGTYWIPFEPTVIGASFAESHRKAVAAYDEMNKGGKASIIDPRAAWATFEPATMPPTDWSPETPKAEEAAQRANPDLEKYGKERFAFLRTVYDGRLNKDGKDVDALVGRGVLELEAGQLEKAGDDFGKALALDQANASAMNNLGSIAFLGGDHAKAKEWFAKASEKDPEDAGIWLNLAKVSAKLKQPEKIKEYGKKAVALDSNLKDVVQALARLN